MLNCSQPDKQVAVAVFLLANVNADKHKHAYSYVHVRGAHLICSLPGSFVAAGRWCSKGVAFRHQAEILRAGKASLQRLAFVWNADTCRLALIPARRYMTS